MWSQAGRVSGALPCPVVLLQLCDTRPKHRNPALQAELRSLEIAPIQGEAAVKLHRKLREYRHFQKQNLPPFLEMSLLFEAWKE